jgi:hypothetical protein
MPRPATEPGSRPDQRNTTRAHADFHTGYELLRGRDEERATLLVRVDNLPAQRAYARWGWQKAGKLRPYPDSPHFDAMILPLPVQQK